MIPTNTGLCRATLTGSYPPFRLPPPPLSKEEIQQSIARAIEDQRNAASGRKVDWIFVSGQPQESIIGILANALGLRGHLPYEILEPIIYRGPSTLTELEITALEAKGQPIKAHVTGPYLLATEENFVKISDRSPAHYRIGVPQSRRNLILDIAYAQAEEIGNIMRVSNEYNIRYLQIDEPTLASASDQDLIIIREALEIMCRASQIPVILHVYLDYDITDLLLSTPVNIINAEWRHLRDLTNLTKERLREAGKQLAIGCIPVNKRHIQTSRQIENQIKIAIERFGPDAIWGITPNSGLRWSSIEMSHLYLGRLAEVADHLSAYLSAGKYA